MPFDEFFSSKNKKHYIPVEGTDELYDKIMAMSYEDRQKTISEWMSRKMTPQEHIALSKLKFICKTKRKAKIHSGKDKCCDNAYAEFKKGKRVIVHGGLNTIRI